MKHSIALIAVALVGSVGLADVAAAKSLRDSLIPAGLVNTPVADALKPFADAIGSQVANQIPALSTSAGYTYVTLDLEGYRSGKMNDTLVSRTNLVPITLLETRRQ